MIAVTIGAGPPKAGAAAAATIIVPTQRPTIQSAIDAASAGDVIYVLPGTYLENIDFKGKDVWLQGFGPGVTIIDGARKGPVVSFTRGESSAAVLRGFTIRNGMTSAVHNLMGGGVLIVDSSPTIMENQITANHGVQGIGVGVERGAPLIYRNEISWNRPDTGDIGRTNGYGGGLHVGHNNGGPPLYVMLNKIVHNAADMGGGIGTNDAGDLYLWGNNIDHNQAYYDGGAFAEINTTRPVFFSNTMTYNTAGDGSALWFSPVVTTPAVMVANHVYGNWSSSLMGGNGRGVGIKLFSTTLTMSGNLFIGEPDHTMFQCEDRIYPSRLSFSEDLILYQGGSIIENCAHVTGR